MFCGINSAEVNLHEINGCRGGIVVTIKHWIDEFIPSVLAYDPTSKGLATCLRPRNRHDKVAPIPKVKLPAGGKRSC